MLNYFLRVGARLAGVVALTMLLAVIAPAQDDDAIPDRYHKSKEPVYLTPQPDHALLYVTRSEYVRLFGLSDFKVLVDDKAAGWLPQRSYLAVQVEPGRSLVWGPSRNEAQRFNFEAGKTYLLALAERYKYVFNGRNRTKVLDATWWIERNPQEIKDLVNTGKLEYVTTAEGAMADLNKEATKKFVKTNDKAHDPVEVVLPVSFEKVQYRHAKKGFSLKSWEDTGALTISRENIEYKSDKMTLVIPLKDVQWFAFDIIHTRTVGILTTNGGLGEAEWNIMDFTSNGQEETIAFRDGHMLGTGADTRRIYAALQAAAPQKVQSSAKVAAAVAALADSSPQPAEAGESQPPVPAATQEGSNESKHDTSASGTATPQNAQPSAPPAQAGSTVRPLVPQGKTLASPVLQQDTLATINMIDIANGPTISDCKIDRRVLKMEVTGQPVGVKFKHDRMVAGSWEERWTVDRCGTPVAYNISFRSDGRGGTDITARIADVADSQKLDSQKLGSEKLDSEKKDSEKKD